ncbi:uncharacterized protein CDV56_101133 [Aspergillus thermomutatus]|uniref:F-box domain-containing protein n=1 Tax=Aspergillus thermomutatus TaxID=41047 RepID=A0A397GGY7_ASPTH|nr:uncharacterized protein CDV56_101133 [Aspergillus thermomutatus]RHZ48948.1 hypothetical protein CDV56_101133 [Aspergillus thermomutatus]
MVVFVDHDHDVFNRHRFLGAHDDTYQAYLLPDKPALSKLKGISSDPSNLPENDHPADSMHGRTKHDGSHEILNRNGFSAALSCYPIVKEIARQVDLNTLYALSRTCRQFYANLAPYRHQLVKQTLRCENEYIETLSDLLDGSAAIPDSVKSVLRLMCSGYGSGVSEMLQDRMQELRHQIPYQKYAQKSRSSSMYHLPNGTLGGPSDLEYFQYNYF